MVSVLCSFFMYSVRNTSISFLLRNGTLKMMKYVFDAAFRIGSRPHKNALCQVSASNYCRSIPRKDLKDFLLFSYRKTIEICWFFSFCIKNLIRLKVMVKFLIFSQSALFLWHTCQFSAQNIHYRPHSGGPNMLSWRNFIKNDP